MICSFVVRCRLTLQLSYNWNWIVTLLCHVRCRKKSHSTSILKSSIIFQTPRTWSFDKCIQQTFSTRAKFNLLFQCRSKSNRSPNLFNIFVRTWVRNNTQASEFQLHSSNIYNNTLQVFAYWNVWSRIMLRSVARITWKLINFHRLEETISKFIKIFLTAFTTLATQFLEQFYEQFFWNVVT